LIQIQAWLAKVQKPLPIFLAPVIAILRICTACCSSLQRLIAVIDARAGVAAKLTSQTQNIVSKGESGPTMGASQQGQ